MFKLEDVIIPLSSPPSWLCLPLWAHPSVIHPDLNDEGNFLSLSDCAKYDGYQKTGRTKGNRPWKINTPLRNTKEGHLEGRSTESLRAVVLEQRLPHPTPWVQILSKWMSSVIWGKLLKCSDSLCVRQDLYEVLKKTVYVKGSPHHLEQSKTLINCSYCYYQ